MTTTTTRPVTAEEIRAAVQYRMDSDEGVNGSDDGFRADIRALVEAASDWIRDPAWTVIESPDSRGDRVDPSPNDPDAIGSPWSYDMRPSEARRLLALTAGVVERAMPRIEALILEEVTAAGVQFAQECPDARRRPTTDTTD